MKISTSRSPLVMDSSSTLNCRSSTFLGNSAVPGVNTRGAITQPRLSLKFHCDVTRTFSPLPADWPVPVCLSEHWPTHLGPAGGCSRSLRRTVEDTRVYIYDTAAPACTSSPHLYVLRLQDAQVLLHLRDAAGGLGHLGPLQVALDQQLLDVLLLLLQGFLQRRGARDLTGVARRRLCQLRRRNVKGPPRT